MSRIVELVKCPTCRCNMVKGEECTMCDELAWEAANPDYNGTHEDRLPQFDH